MFPDVFREGGGEGQRKGALGTYENNVPQNKHDAEH